jgi:hypothetical protein
MIAIDYNKKYHKEDIEELRAWFASHTLPQSMQIDESTFTPNLKKTVDALMHQAQRIYDNPNLYGVIYILERIRGHLTETENNKEGKTEQ